MGIFVGWFANGRWWFLAGFAVVVVAIALPWPHGLRDGAVLAGGVIMLMQLPIAYAEARRRRR